LGMWSFAQPSQLLYDTRANSSSKVETPYHDNDLIRIPIMSSQSG
jgi:hypothetical protein